MLKRLLTGEVRRPVDHLTIGKPEPSPENSEPMMADLIRQIQKDLVQHIEEFAAAYIKHTSIQPDQAVMVVKHTRDENGDIIQKIWFEHKKEPWEA